MTATDDHPIALVPGRECGECVACCVHLWIPELGKPSNIACRHCTGIGCGIHAARPAVCRDFHCAWRMKDFLGDEWRPDRSGVILFRARAEGHAPGGLELVLTQNEAAIRRPGFAALVMRLMREGCAVVMTVLDRSALLNPHLEKILPLGEEAVQKELLRFYAGATTYRNSRDLPP